VSYEPLHHKYRPKTFAELVGQEAIATTLTNAIHSERIAPAYLFTGPRGTGKTSSARILAKSLNCKKQDKPTEAPCGICDVCKSIASGSAVDVIEIDAASNTGVDNIRELIEKAQFAPIQCRYKVYVIDECLTGDSLVQTSEGLMRIDEPSLKGKKVLSYNESLAVWEFKTVLRWLDQGVRETFVIKTTNCEIRCTGNHLIRTEAGWIAAKNVKEGMKILSPVNVDAAPFQFRQWITNLERVESVRVAGVERVYDIEVEDNHNFVANELLVHNCHMLSTAAFNALLKTLEEPPARIVFVLATTDPQRVLPTIISRCQRFDFRRIPLEAMVQHLQDIASKETINITADALTLVAQVAQGGLRDAESLLDQLSLLPGQVTVEQVWDLVGAVPERDLMALTEAIASNDPQAVLDKCRRLMDKGREPLVVLQNLAGFYRDLLIAKTAPTRSDLVAVTPPTWNQLCGFTEKLDISSILQGQQHLKNSEAQIKNTTQPRLWLEVTLLGLLPSALSANVVARNEERSPSGIAFKPSTNNRSESSVSDREVLAKQGIAQRPPSAFKQIGEHHPTEPRSHSIAQPLDANGGAVNQPQTTPPNQISKASAISSQPPSAERTDDSITAASSHSNSTPASDIERSSNAQEDINEIWQQVLEHIQPRATRELLRQHCRLVAFDRSTARIGISSEPLLKMAQTRVANIEAAFEAVYTTKVKVNLQTNSSESFKTAPARTLNTSTEQNSEEVVTPAATNYPPKLPVRQEPPEIEDERSRQGERENVLPFSRRSDNRITSTPVSDAANSPRNAHRLNSEAPLAYAETRVPAVQRDEVTSRELQRDVASVSLSQSQSSIPTQDLDWDAEEVEMALGNLKQFFEGEIVDLTDDFEPSESLITKDTPEVATVTLSEQASNAVSDPLEDELTEELDFVEPAPSYYQPLSDTTNSSNSEEFLELEDVSDNDDDIPF
jgi:DNA polymerase III subunit gamma/tau